MITRHQIKQFLQKFSKEFQPLNHIEISRSAILHNYDLTQNLNPGREIWPVLKANAYGHGLAPITEILKKRKCAYMVVDGYFEARRIWQVSPKQKVLLIGEINPINFINMDFSRAVITVQDIDSVRALGKINQNVKIHLKINTGMNRQGIEPKELRQYIEEIKKYKNLELEGVFSHFADANSLDDAFTAKQKNVFNQIVEKADKLQARSKYFHLAASAGSVKVTNPRINAVRLGLHLYGLNRLDERDPQYSKFAELKPALRFISTITKVRVIEAGEKVGYNLTYTAPRKTRLALLPVGYYEIVPWNLSNKGWVKYKDKFLPIVGRVSMNIIIIDLLDTDARAWDTVDVVSPIQTDKNSITNIAKLANTISGEILVKANESTRRIIAE